MSEMSSFYGGRQGNSIVIAKRFDGIDIPQVAGSYVYTRALYAVDEHGNFITVADGTISGAVGVGVVGSSGEYEHSTTNFLIKKNKTNYLGDGIPGFEGWGGHDNDGALIDTLHNWVFVPELAQGMVQFFKEGAKTSSEVNYGAYVIIDTIQNMVSLNDPDNGKVYRRGMDINSTDGLAGAEYIGQIVGPQGECPELDLDTFLTVQALTPHQEREYTPGASDIVPGSYTLNGARFYEDEVKFAWATIRDAFGNVTGCKIGFKLPTLVQDFEAQSMSPYQQRAIDSETGKYYNHDLIDEDPEQYDSLTEQWHHPFFQKWQIKVPHGYHGINPEDIEVIHSYTQTVKYKGDVIKIYNTADCSDDDVYMTVTDEDTSYPVLGAQYKYIEGAASVDSDDTDGLSHLDKIQNKYYMRYGAEYDTSSSVISCKIEMDGGIKYVKKEDCYMDILRYREIDFDDEEAGIARYFYIGDYDVIDRVTLAPDGTVTVFYTSKPSPEELEEVIRWIDTENADGITIDDDGTVHVYYNTTHKDSSGKVVHDQQDFDNVLDWITEASLSSDGQFKILYNNDTVTVGHDKEGNPIKGDTYQTTLQWIDYIDFADDGTVTFRWNTDTSRTGTPAYQFSKKIKYIDDLYIETAVDGGVEGSGDQYVHVKYNTEDEDQTIGQPLNYIIETCVSTPTTAYPNIPYSHLLVYYSDPALREKYKDKWVTAPSTKIVDSYITDAEGNQTPVYHVWTEWVDMGNVRGEAGGIHIIKNVASLGDLKDNSGNYIPPERLADSDGTIINPNGAGWGCSMDVSGSATAKEILFYDYENKVWYSVGTIDASSAEPTYMVVKSAPTADMLPASADVSVLKTNGIWFAAETIIYAG